MSKGSGQREQRKAKAPGQTGNRMAQSYDEIDEEQRRRTRRMPRLQGDGVGKKQPSDDEEVVQEQRRRRRLVPAERRRAWRPRSEQRQTRIGAL